MGWSKKIEIDSGVTVLYWEVASVQFDSSSTILKADCLGYLSEDSKKSGKAPAMRRSISFSITEPSLSGLVGSVYATVEKLWSVRDGP